MDLQNLLKESFFRPLFFGGLIDGGPSKSSSTVGQSPFPYPLGVLLFILVLLELNRRNASLL